MKKFLIPITTLMICLSITYVWTSGFKAFTIFSYTLKEAGKYPRDFPDVSFINQDSTVFRIDKQDKYVLMNFVYLDCPNVCHKVNNRLEEIYNSSLSKWIPNRLELVTVSFDPKDDNLKKIRMYRHFFGTNAELKGWNFALPYHLNKQQFDDFLKKVGVWAEPVPGTNIINHSTYLFLIAPNGKIVTAINPIKKTNKEIINQVAQWVKK